MLVEVGRWRVDGDYEMPVAARKMVRATLMGTTPTR